MEVKSYFWIWRRKKEKKKKRVPWPTSSFQPKPIHTHTIEIYCSIEFSTIFIWVLGSLLDRKKLSRSTAQHQRREAEGNIFSVLRLTQSGCETGLRWCEKFLDSLLPLCERQGSFCNPHYKMNTKQNKSQQSLFLFISVEAWRSFQRIFIFITQRERNFRLYKSSCRSNVDTRKIRSSGSGNVNILSHGACLHYKHIAHLNVPLFRLAKLAV